MCTMNRGFERLERPPLGAVTPPDGEAKAGYRGPGVHQSHDWDALDGELTGNRQRHSAHSRGHLGLK